MIIVIVIIVSHRCIWNNSFAILPIKHSIPKAKYPETRRNEKKQSVDIVNNSKEKQKNMRTPHSKKSFLHPFTDIHMANRVNILKICFISLYQFTWIVVKAYVLNKLTLIPPPGPIRKNLQRARFGKYKSPTVYWFVFSETTLLPNSVP